MATHSSILTWRIPVDSGTWRATVHGFAESNMTEQLSIAHRQKTSKGGLTSPDALALRYEYVRIIDLLNVPDEDAGTTHSLQYKCRVLAIRPPGNSLKHTALSPEGENNLSNSVLEQAWLFMLVKIFALRRHVMLDQSFHPS